MKINVNLKNDISARNDNFLPVLDQPILVKNATTIDPPTYASFNNLDKKNSREKTSGEQPTMLAMPPLQRSGTNAFQGLPTL